MHELLEEYKLISGHEVIDQLEQLAKQLQGIRIVHVNSTQTGGGVAEILWKMVPLTKALGIETNWEIIKGNPEFFQCTKSFHNALQGNHVVMPASQFRSYEETNAANADMLRPILEEADFVFIHDPQPLALIAHMPKRKGKWIWRCHIDASRPIRHIWKYLRNYVEQYDAAIFSLAEFAQPLAKPMFIILPSIDPLSEKNMELELPQIKEVYDRFRIDPVRPLLLQVSRYDRFKDPLGVIEAYRLVKKFNPHVQLVLAGGGASDDPEGELVLNETKKAAEGDPDIHVLLLPDNAHRTINALQRAADIVIQKSLREGFGLTVTEGLWKGKPVIGGNTGGIRVQVINGQTGFLVNTPEGASARIRYLLQNRELIDEIGIKAKEYVREKFLITRQLREYLTLIYSLRFEKSDRIELG